MMRMGFSADEIRDSLMTNKYDEVMATYLLLDEKRVSTFLPNTHIPKSVEVISVVNSLFSPLGWMGAYQQFVVLGWGTILETGFT